MRERGLVAHRECELSAHGEVGIVEVETGIIGESDRQILSGLKEGDEVITGPSRVLNTLKDGAVVKKQVKKEGEAANKAS